MTRSTTTVAQFSIRRVVGGCLVICVIQVIVLVTRQAKNSVRIGESMGGKQTDSSYFDFPHQITQAIVDSILPQSKPSTIFEKKHKKKYSIISPNDDASMTEFVPIQPINESTNAALPHPHAGSRFPDGTFGYIADPTRLRRTVLAYHEGKNYSNADDNYFDRIMHLQERYRNGTMTGSIPLSHDHVCNVGPGRSFEDDGGFKVLAEKIRIAPASSYEATDDGSKTREGPRILCSIYTYRKMRDLARIQALSWGYKCDGFLAFSTETIPELGMLEILHVGAESYQNMWQKVRSIWAYISDHYLEDYDWFHLGGDDLYIIVENMRRFLKQVEQRQREKNATEEPLLLGSWVKQPGKQPDFVAGAPGYTMNREALTQFVTRALHNCSITHAVSHEDRLISKCMYYIGINQSDTRDYETGEPQYHDCGPNHLYTFRTGHNPSFHSKIALNWENATHPKYPTQRVGPKHGLEAAATYSIAFHDIYHPSFVARLHSILYPETCPATSALGRAMRLYGIVEDG